MGPDARRGPDVEDVVRGIPLVAQTAKRLVGTVKPFRDAVGWGRFDIERHAAGLPDGDVLEAAVARLATGQRIPDPLGHPTGGESRGVAGTGGANRLAASVRGELGDGVCEASSIVRTTGANAQALTKASRRRLAATQHDDRNLPATHEEGNSAGQAEASDGLPAIVPGERPGWHHRESVLGQELG